MEQSRIIEVKREIMADNSSEADVFRTRLKDEGTFYMDVMASPGGGKTTLLLGIIERLHAEAELAIIEADLESTVDAEKIKAAGVDSVELNTYGVCHVEMGMVERAWAAFGGKHYDYLFLENIGNLVCPADFDTGAHCRIMLLSVPEGYDKVYKYPPMFAVSDALVVTKTDYLPMNLDFDMAALKRRANEINPDMRIFEVSARTDQGMDELTDWVRQMRRTSLGM